MSPSSTVYGGRHDTKYATFELLLHAGPVADEKWGIMLEPARTCHGSIVCPLSHGSIVCPLTTRLCSVQPNSKAEQYQVRVQ